MGAYSSSAFWVDRTYVHASKKLLTFYEKVEPHFHITHDVDFTIQNALDLLEKKNLFPEITLILDIDLTLGEACPIRYDYVQGFLLDNTPMDFNQINRIINEGKAAWFHDKTCVFFLRPYFREFIKFCDQNFKEVIIWTNGSQQHADDMVDLIQSIIGKKWRGFGRSFSTYDRKIVTSIGLDPKTTWLVDDDHRHYYRTEDRDETKEVNPDIKFFHGPEFSLCWFKDLSSKLYLWGPELEVYDDWFLFLIWNWHYIKENNIEIQKFDKNKNKFIY